MHKNNSSVIKRLASLIVIVSGLSAFPSYSQAEDILALNDYTFGCYRNPKDGTPTTFIVPKGKEKVGIPLISWKSTAFSNSGWIPVRRCLEVSKRFNDLYKRNSLNYIANAYFAGQPAICGFQDLKRSSCTSENLLFTLANNSDADRVLEELDGIINDRAIADLSIIVDEELVRSDENRRACLSRSASGNCSGVLFTTLVQ